MMQPEAGSAWQCSPVLAVMLGRPPSPGCVQWKGCACPCVSPGLALIAGIEHIDRHRGYRAGCAAMSRAPLGWRGQGFHPQTHPMLLNNRASCGRGVGERNLFGVLGIWLLYNPSCSLACWGGGCRMCLGAPQHGMSWAKQMGSKQPALPQQHLFLHETWPP